MVSLFSFAIRYMPVVPAVTTAGAAAAVLSCKVQCKWESTEYLIKGSKAEKEWKNKLNETKTD